MKLFNIGFSNYIALDRLVSVLCVDSAPIKRLVHIAKEKNLLIDCTCGRKTGCVLVMDTGHVILSATSSEIVTDKIHKAYEEEIN